MSLERNFLQERMAEGFADGQSQSLDWKSAMSGDWGSKPGVNSGSSIEFMDFRPYLPGDDIRRIDWNVYARTDSLIVKQYQNEIRPHVDILIDGSKSMAISDWKAGQTMYRAGFYCGASEKAGFSHTCWLPEFQPQAKAANNKAANNKAANNKAANNKAANNKAANNKAARQSGAATSDVGGATGNYLRFTYQQWFNEPNLLPRFDASVSWGEALSAFGCPCAPQGYRILISDLLWPEDPLKCAAEFAAKAAKTLIVEILAKNDLEPDIWGNYRIIDCETQNFSELNISADTLTAYKRRLSEHRNRWVQACRAEGIALFSDAEIDAEKDAAISDRLP